MRKVAFRRKRAVERAVLLAALSASLVLYGCSSVVSDGMTDPTPSESDQGLPEVTAEDREACYYRIDVCELPDVDRGLELPCERGQKLAAGWSESDRFQIVGEKLYRPVETVRYLDEEERAEAGLAEEDPGVVSCGRYIQYLEPPYTKCEYILLDGNWAQGEQWVEQKLRVTEEGQMQVLLKKEESEDFAVGEVARDGSCKLLSDAMPDELIESVEMELPPREDADPWEYLLNKRDEPVPPVVCADERTGEIYYSDPDGLWRYDKAGAEELLYYADQDVVMDVVRGLRRTEDGGFLVVGGYRSESFLLKITPVSEPVKLQKQKVVLASPIEYWVLNEVVTHFNRKNKDYRVVIMKAKDCSKEGLEDYRTNIVRQLSKGAGPDLLSYGLFLDFASLAKQGYLADLGDMMDDEEDFFPAAKESGVIDGIRYGVPVEGFIHLLACRQELVGDLDSWTAEQLMTAVEESGAEWAGYEAHRGLLEATRIVYLMGLWDDRNPAYIDWEAGESHLAEQPFIRLMEFAKEYEGTSKGVYGYKHGTVVKEGKIALEEVNPSNLFELQWFDECFDGEAAFIGYPSTEGSGIKMTFYGYYINASSGCPEGAREFLRYLLTDEAQTIMTIGEYGSALSVKRSALEKNLRRIAETGETFGDSYFTEGIGVTLRPFTQEECDWIVDMVMRAEPEESEADGIWEMMKEELTPYFEGECSAEEAAKKLDQRVQRYLDMRKWEKGEEE